jgi:hypothetical protein
MLFPDAELSEPVYNEVFVSNKYVLDKVGEFSFKWDEDNSTSNSWTFYNSPGSKYVSKLTNIPDGTKLRTNGEDYFSALAGTHAEAYRTADVELDWN